MICFHTVDVEYLQNRLFSHEVTIDLLHEQPLIHQYQNQILLWDFPHSIIYKNSIN